MIHEKASVKNHFELRRKIPFPYLSRKDNNIGTFHCALPEACEAVSIDALIVICVSHAAEASPFHIEFIDINNLDSIRERI